MFHEIAGDAFTAIDPIDGAGWMRAIENRSGASPAPAVPIPPTDPGLFFRRVENFIDLL